MGCRLLTLFSRLLVIAAAATFVLGLAGGAAKAHATAIDAAWSAQAATDDAGEPDASDDAAGDAAEDPAPEPPLARGWTPPPRAGLLRPGATAPGRPADLASNLDPPPRRPLA